jgi:prepilin-type N-terminal cleavage/methylation domain-containing protein
MQNKKGLALSLSKGFTIIELIVVIAIIAVLAAIVLVNVTSYINKGKDAAAEGNLASMITASNVWYDDSSGGNGSYLNWTAGYPGCNEGSAPSFMSSCNALENAGYAVIATCDTAKCLGTPTKWCASVTSKVNTTKSFCVDSTGAKYNSTTSVCQTSGDIGACLP